MSYFPEQKEAFAELLQAVDGQRVAVLGHLRPDGDCIGSQVALTRVLRARGVDAVAVNRHPSPRDIFPVVGDTPLRLAEDFEPSGHVSINVDCADPIRVSKGLINQFPETLGNIDHHISNPNYAAINIVEPNSAATAHSAPPITPEARQMRHRRR